MADLNYYESGYIEQWYLVYTADAESQQTSTAEITCDASVIAGGVAVFASGDLTSFAILECTISHIHGADLFAFSEAALAAQAEVIRETNIELSTQFNVATTAVRGIYVSAQADEVAIVSADNLRVRFVEAATDAAFSLDIDVFVIIEGADLKEYLNVQLTSIANIIRTITSNINAETFITTNVNKLIGINAEIYSLVDLTASGDRTQQFNTTINSNCNLSSPFGLIKQASSEYNALFTPTLTVDVFKNSFSILESNSNLQILCLANKTLDSKINFISSISSIGLKLTSVSPNPTIFSGGVRGTVEFNPTIKKFGTHSLKFNATDTNTYPAIIQYPNRLEWRTWRTIDLWFYVEGNTTAIPRSMFDLLRLPGISSYWNISLYINNGTTGKLQFNGVTSTQTYNNNTWNHVRVIRDNYSVRVFLNGQRTDISTALPLSSENLNSLRIQGDQFNYGYSSIYVDEIMITDQLLTPATATTITIPTTSWIDKDIIDGGGSLLTHFDNSHRNTSSYYLIFAEAVLQSSCSLLINAARIQSPVAPLISRFLINANIGKLKQYSSNITSSFTENVNTLRIKSSTINSSSIASSLVIIGKRIGSAIDLDIVSSISVTSIKKTTGRSTITCQSTVSSNLSKIKRFGSTLSTTSSINVIIYKVKESTINLNVISVQTTHSSIIFNLQSYINLVSSMSCNVVLLKTLIIAQQSRSTLTINAGKVLPITSNIISNTMLSISARMSTDIQVDLVVDTFVLALSREIILNIGAIWIVPHEIQMWEVPTDITTYFVNNEKRIYYIEGI